MRDHTEIGLGEILAGKRPGEMSDQGLTQGLAVCAMGVYIVPWWRPIKHLKNRLSLRWLCAEYARRAGLVAATPTDRD